MRPTDKEKISQVDERAFQAGPGNGNADAGFGPGDPGAGGEPDRYVSEGFGSGDNGFGKDASELAKSMQQMQQQMEKMGRIWRSN